jgi:hypothetical protein
MSWSSSSANYEDFSLDILKDLDVEFETDFFLAKWLPAFISKRTCLLTFHSMTEYKYESDFNRKGFVTQWDFKRGRNFTGLLVALYLFQSLCSSVFLKVMFRVYVCAYHSCDFKMWPVIARGVYTGLLHWKFAFVYIFMEITQTKGTLHL